MFSFLRPSGGPACPSVPDIAAAVANGEMILIDVREQAEVRASGLAAGAMHIPMAILHLRADPQAPDASLRPGKPVVLYCASGARSGMAARMLRQMGYDPVWNLGGLHDWIAGGGTVKRA